MAVEASHLNFFTPQLIGKSREIMNSIQGNSSNIYNAALQNHHHNHFVGTFGEMPIPSTIETYPLNANYSLINNSSIQYSANPPKMATVKKSDSGITTYNNTAPVSRKRSLESASPLMTSSYSPVLNASYNSTNCNGNSFSFLGDDISLQIQQQQLDVDHLIAKHNEKVRIEIEERRKRQVKRILEAIEVGIAKRLRGKEEEIDNIGKLNWALEERVKSLCIENQIWRDLARNNEATANALRTNLEQVLAQVKDVRAHGGAGLVDPANTDGDENGVVAELADDAQSCCGENDVGSSEWRNDGVSSEQKSSRKCRSCGKGESCVLLLPCRHLCLCSACGSSQNTCPICKSTKNASVNVNMS